MKKMVLFDLDDTILWDKKSVQDAFDLTCRLAEKEAGTNPVELEKMFVRGQENYMLLTRPMLIHKKLASIHLKVCGQRLKTRGGVPQAAGNRSCIPGESLAGGVKRYWGGSAGTC